MNWIKALYNEPLARVQSNGMISPPIQLFRSTRQSCPASPALFILALEPLACAISSNQNIPGVDIGGYVFKVVLSGDLKKIKINKLITVFVIN